MGVPFPGVDVRVAADGEVLVRGAGVMRGYYRDEDATRAAIDAEGWFHTGDVGQLDAEGRLSISHRKKEILVTSGGKNISPLRIEEELLRSAFITQACAIADGRNFVSALLVPNLEAVAAHLRQKGMRALPRAEMASLPAVLELIEHEIGRANAQLPHYETVRRFALVADEFTPGNGLLTPTLKLRRQPIEKAYQSVIDLMYSPSAEA